MKKRRHLLREQDLHLGGISGAIAVTPLCELERQRYIPTTRVKVVPGVKHKCFHWMRIDGFSVKGHRLL